VSRGIALLSRAMDKLTIDRTGGVLIRRKPMEAPKGS